MRSMLSSIDYFKICYELGSAYGYVARLRQGSRIRMVKEVIRRGVELGISAIRYVESHEGDYLRSCSCGSASCRLVMACRDFAYAIGASPKASVSQTQGECN